MCLCLSISGCSGQNDIKNITPQECNALLKESAIQLVDVRSAQEYEKEHLQGAILISLEDPNFKVQATQTLDKQQPVVLYCRSGKRSMTAANILANEGFTTVYNLKGGILEWQTESLPTER